MSIHKPLVITVESEGGPRRVRAVSEAAAYGLAPEFVVSIPRDDPRITAVYDVETNRRWRKYEMTAAEVSCYCGHRLAWAQVRDGDSPFRLILEDDFEIVDPVALDRLERVAERLKGWDIIMLSRFQPRGRFRVIAADGFELRDYQYGPTSAVGYLITPVGAERMLSRKKIFRPIDEDFINPWELDIRVLAVAPDIVKEHEHSISKIENERAKRQHSVSKSVRDIFLKARWQVLSRFHWWRRGYLHQ